MSTVDRRQIAVQAPLTARVGHYFRIWSMRALIRMLVWFKTYISLPPRQSRPTYLKVYPVEPTVTNRVWIPRTYKPGDPPLPLFIVAHGGGFSLGHPLLDDPDSEELCQKHGLCVVSIGYKLAPTYKWPIPVESVASIIQAVLDDPELPVDKSKVAIGGYSAGASLTLCASQLNGLNKVIKGIVAYYPTTNMTHTREDKAARGILKPGLTEDFLFPMLMAFHWAYLAPGTEKASPTLSPHYAKREALPEKVYMIGCEWDLLCPEAEDTAEKYAESEAGEKTLDPEDGKTVGWTKGNLRWRKMLKAEHGFNQVAAQQAPPGPEKDRLMALSRDMHADVVRWLKAEVYA